MRDGLHGRATPGLGEAVSKFYFEQLDSLDQTGGKRCPGETPCAAPPGEPNTADYNKGSGPLYKEVALRRGRSFESVCGACPMRGTKPDQHSPHLATALALAGRLDSLRQSGASFPYPGAFNSPFWWTCLEASAEGRRRADEARYERQEQKRKREEEQRDQKLKAMQGRGGRGGRR